MSSTRPTAASRYHVVQAILDQAAGTSQASYQGHGRFWNLPLGQFLDFTLYGVRLIAPARGSGSPALARIPSLPKVGGTGGGCCHAPKAAPTPTLAQAGAGVGSGSVQPAPGRGAASGLIRGLRGQAPFDGSQFPRLPWGGQAVAEDDIRFIERWIDDGCPESEGSAVGPGSTGASSVEGGDNVLAALHRGDAAHPPSDGAINDYHDGAGSLKARKNIESMTDEEKARFRAAVQRMRSLDAYTQDERSFGYWGRLHGNNCQHAWEEFLTWHRAYLYFFEQQLQDIDPAVTLPYWDWTQYDQDWKLGTVDSGVIPADYQCWLDAEAMDGLKGQIPDDWMARLKTLGTTRFGSANRLFAAAGIAYVPLLDPVTFQPAPANNPTQAVMDALQRVNPLWHRLRWPGPNNPSPEVSPFFQAYPTSEDIDRILDLSDFFQFGSGPDSNHFFGALENVHNLMHNFSGGINPFWESALSSLPSTSPYDPQNRWEPQYGDMVSAGVTAFDPIFWAHHSNVDRLWAEWQKRHPGTSPDNLDSSLSPWGMTVADTMSTSRMGYEYLRSAHLFETNPDVAFTRFRSAPAGVAPKVLTTYRRAEIRLHRVKFSVHGGCFIRVFLNQPDASPQTSISNNDHYVGQLSLFSGYCVGGPGHCEPPPDERRKFDLRPRHRKTPANFRIDATETVRRLVAQGEKDLHITLVVLDLNGRPKDKALWMKAVSLVFVD